MTHMEELSISIEKQRRDLQNLINTKRNLVDLEIIEASQELDTQLNRYHNSLDKRNPS